MPSSQHSSAVVAQQSASVRANPFAVFTDMPCEIVIMIADYCSRKEVNALAKQNSVLYEWLNEYLYKEDIKTGSSAWFWAAVEGRLGTLKLLIEHGIDVQLSNSPENTYLTGDGWAWAPNCNGTALHVAAKYGQLDVIDFLIKQGLDIEQKTTASTTDPTQKHNPMELAIKYSNPSIGMFLIRKGFGANLANGLRQEAFQMALSSYHGLRMSFPQQLLLLQLLLQSGVDVNLPVPLIIPGNFGTSAPTSLDAVFEYANHGGLERIPPLLDMLIEHGVDTHQKLVQHANSTPLHMASILGLTELAKYLLDHGANIESEDGWGRTPLAYATAMSSELKRLPLYDRRCWPDMPYWVNGRRMMRFKDLKLSWAGSVDTVNLLLEHGADPDDMGRYEKGRPQYSPQDLAARNTDPSFKVAFAGGLVSKEAI